LLPAECLSFGKQIRGYIHSVWESDVSDAETDKCEEQFMIDGACEQLYNNGGRVRAAANPQRGYPPTTGEME
jgi:hypothetical protein